MSGTRDRIAAFNLDPGRVLGGRYRVDAFLGGGWEGEVYKVTESATGISRAAKLFYPHRNERDEAVRRYAQKLNRLRDCQAIIQYHHTETVRFRSQRVTCLISELVEGELLMRFVRRHQGKRLHPYEAVCLLHALTESIEQIHDAGEYHGDLHEGNVLVARKGINFVVRMVDFYHRGQAVREARRDDVVDLVLLFYLSLGGQKTYASHPQWVKDIIRGRRRDLILRRFPTAAKLRRHLETFDWRNGA